MERSDIATPTYQDEGLPRVTLEVGGVVVLDLHPADAQVLASMLMRAAKQARLEARLANRRTPHG